MKQAFQGIGVVVVIFLLFACPLVSALGGYRAAPDQAPQATPSATPEPLLQCDSAAVVDATYNGLDRLQVDRLVESAADAQSANTKSVHTSTVGRFVSDISPLLLPCTVLGVVWAVAWTYTKEQERRSNDRVTALIDKATALVKSRAQPPPGE